MNALNLIVESDSRVIITTANKKSDIYSAGSETHGGTVLTVHICRNSRFQLHQVGQYMEKMVGVVQLAFGRAAVCVHVHLAFVFRPSVLVP
jgi:hypothetical protein